MSEFDDMTTEQLREALRAYNPDQQAAPVTAPPTSAADHAIQKRTEGIMAKPAGQWTPEDREFMSKGIADWEKTR